ncbi:MAG: hypothetical protein R2801_05925 [Chitinophagales bacterium]
MRNYANRAMIGGMVETILVVRIQLSMVLRNHVLSSQAFLSDGSFVEFSSISNTDFETKRQINSLEKNISIYL